MSALSIRPGSGWRRNAERSLAFVMIDPLDSKRKWFMPGYEDMMVRYAISRDCQRVIRLLKTSKYEYHSQGALHVLFLVA